MAGTSRPPRLFTARYQNPTLADHPAGKVRITLGAPRFRLPYELAGAVRQLAPTWSMLHQPEAEFAIRYRQLLEQRGHGALGAARFTALVTRNARVTCTTLVPS